MRSKFIECVAGNSKVFGAEIFHNGKIIDSYVPEPDKRHPIYSATKSFLSAAAGLVWDSGKLDLEQPLLNYLTEKQLKLIPDEALFRNFYAHEFSRFLTMTVSGFAFRPEGSDWERFCLSQPVVFKDVPEFQYTNISAYFVGLALENIVDMSLADYMSPRLFEPLGIIDPVYAVDPSGHFYGASGMELTVHELSLLGQLYLQNGIFGGKRILSEAWVRLSTAKHVENSEGGYGYFFWTKGESFRISGKWGQKCMVYPSKNLMITYLSHFPEGGGEILSAAEDLTLYLLV